MSCGRVVGCVLTILVGVGPAAAQPWGVSASASSARDHADWFPRMTAAGVTSVRLFPEWRGFEPKRGTWNWDHGDALVKAAADHKLELSAVLMGSPPGAKAVHAFPMDDLDGWANYVSTVVGRYGKQVRAWEVWNEGNGGFNDGKHTTADYAKLAAATYAAAKKADPRARVGLTVASFDVPYLNQTILEMKKAGKADSFDYLCIHPYEIADGLADPDGEIPFLWMSRLLRDMLQASAPEKAAAELWITEVGRRVEDRKPRAVTDRDAASGLAKMYTMALAQGIARVLWFEARDPVGEDQGFGLLRRDGTPRPAYATLKTLTTHLGPTPKYRGWVALGRGGRGYGFVFDGKDGPVLIAWMPVGLTSETRDYSADVDVTDLATAKTMTFRAGSNPRLTDTPVLITGVPARMASLTASEKPFPWGGNYSTAKVVSLEPGSPDAGGGIFQVGRGQHPTVKFPDGSTGLLVQGDISHPVRFYVHPSFAKFQTTEYYVRVTVRRVSGGNVGMNLLYEVADSRGKAAYANTGQWFGTTADDGWQAHTWHVKDACFSKMWGYDFVLRPEQSVPFAIGKVEVSTEPFR